MPIPPTLDLDITTTSASTKSTVETVLQEKYNTATDWAQYAATLMETNIASITNLLAEDTVSANLTALQAALDAISAYPTPPDFTYTAPVAPSYTSVPAYVAQTLGEIAVVPSITATLGELLPLPAIDPIDVGAVPDTTVSFDNSDFSNPLLDSLQSNLSIDLSSGSITFTPVGSFAEVTAEDIVIGADTTFATLTPSTFTFNRFSAGSVTLADWLSSDLGGAVTIQEFEMGGTGLGAAEDALFARETARQSATRVAAYNELTAQFAARGFDMPPGALLAMQTEVNNESNIRLSDSSSQIMAESARLAQAWNVTVVGANAQIRIEVARLNQSLAQSLLTANTQIRLDVARLNQAWALEIDKLNAQIQADEARTNLSATQNADQLNTQRLLEAEKINQLYKIEAERLTQAWTNSVNQINATYRIEKEKINQQYLIEGERLTQAKRQTTITSSTQLQDVLARIFDSKIMRSFEASKNTAMLALERFKQVVAAAIATADVQQKQVAATVSYNEGVVRTYLGEVEGQKATIEGVVASNAGTVEVFKAQIDGQVAPMKAIAETNQAVATSYKAAVDGARADLEAQVVPEELKIRGVELNTRIAEAKGRLAEAQARLTVENAARQLQLEVTTLSGLAAGAQQMIAAALNGVSVTTSMDWRGSTSSSVSEQNAGTVSNTYDENGKLTETTYNPDVF